MQFFPTGDLDFVVRKPSLSIGGSRRIDIVAI
jgi:hypothetical protein